jgi:dolichol kinase
MQNSLLNTILLAASFLGLFGIGELLYHLAKVRVEFTRKLVHIGTGFITLLFPILLNNHLYVLALCTSFAIILVLSKRYGLLKSINAIDRDSFGSIAYPISVYGCYLCYSYYNNYIFFYIPILVLALADPAAALCGKRWPYGKYHIGTETKTLMGSSAFLVVAILTSLVCFRLNVRCDITHVLVFSAFIGCLCSVAEALSRKGWDNVTVPLVALFLLVLGRSLGLIRGL